MEIIFEIPGMVSRNLVRKNPNPIHLLFDIYVQRRPSMIKNI